MNAASKSLRLAWTAATSSTTTTCFPVLSTATSDLWDMTVTTAGPGITLVPVNTAMPRYPPVPVSPAPEPPPRGFNLYLSAFDLLTEFTKEAEAAGVRRRDFVALPVELFVTWLMLKSAEFEGVDPPDGTPKSLPFPKRGRCLACGRFIPRTHRELQFPYCAPQCLERRQGRLDALHRPVR